MLSLSGLRPLSFTPTLTSRQHVIKKSLLGRGLEVYFETPIPSFQCSKHNASMLCRATSYGREKVMSIAMSSMTLQVNLPAVDCLFEKTCNPKYESVRDECDMWTLSLFDPPLEMHDSNYLLYLKGLYPLFTSLIYPSCPSQRRLVLITKLTNWLFILDDILDKVDSRMQVELMHGLKSIFEVDLGQNSPHFKKKKMDRSSLLPLDSSCERDTRSWCVRVFMDRFKEEVWEEMIIDMTPSIRERFVAQILSSLNAMQQNAQMCQKRRSGVDESKDFTLDDLLELRLSDSFTRPYFGGLLEYALNINLEDILGHKHKGIESLREKVEKLKHVSVCQAAWTNDLFSLRKEFFEDEYLSVINILSKKRGVDAHAMDERGVKIVQEVIQDVWKMIKEQETIGACLLEEIKKSRELEPYAHNQVVMYCEELCKAMAGHMYWSTLTARYNGLSPLPWKTCTSFNISYHNKFPTLDFLHL